MTHPFATKSNSSFSAVASPQIQFDADQKVQGLDALTGAHNFAPEPSVKPKPPVSTAGEPVQDVSDSTSVLVDTANYAEEPASVSYISFLWPYLLVATTLIGWVIYQLRLKRAPSFKHHKIPVRTQNETGPQLTGHFKKSERFQKTENETGSPEWTSEQNSETGSNTTGLANELQDNNKEETIATPAVVQTSETAPSSIDSELANEHQDGKTQADHPTDEDDPQLTERFKKSERFVKPKPGTSTPPTNEKVSKTAKQQNDNRQSDRPADDEFDVSPIDGISDSDIFSEEVAAEMTKAADAKHPHRPSKRFKTALNKEKSAKSDPKRI